MFHGHQPMAIDLSVGIGDPHGQVDQVTPFILARHGLNAMAVTDIAINREAAP
jgi:hypothetical protein